MVFFNGLVRPSSLGDVEAFDYDAEAANESDDEADVSISERSDRVSMHIVCLIYCLFYELALKQVTLLPLFFQPRLL